MILNYNVAPFLSLCLQSVEKALESIDGEIIVVDNNSDDHSCNMVTRDFPMVHLIENKDNFGFSKGNNIGVEHAKGDYVCILNPDTVVTEDSFTKLLDYAASHEPFGAIGCKMIDGQGRFLKESKRHIPTPMVALKKLLGWPSSYYFNELDEDDNGSTAILVGALMLFNRERYSQVGGFDEDYFMYGEDIDLSFRLLQCGYPNYYLGSLPIIHFKGESTLKDKIYARRFYGAMKIFYKKHFRKNDFAGGLVNLGIKLASKLPSLNVDKQIKYSQVMVFSKKPLKLSHLFNVTVIFKEQLEGIDPKTLVIFDADFISFKQMIEFMQSQEQKSRIYYRIKPKKANFILGSDWSSSRGEQLFLK